MRKFLTAILFIIIFLILLAASGFFYVYHQIETPLAIKGEEREVSITEGLGVKAIGRQLESEGLICCANYFNFYIYLNNVKNLKAGDYSLSPSMSIPEIVDTLASGKVISHDVKVTIPEGFTVKEIDARLAAAGLIQPGEIADLDPQRVSSFKLQASSLEGYLFPDTYNFDRKTTADDIVQKMLDNFDKKLTPEMRAEIERQGRTLNDIIIIASIVQQEASSTEEMPRIAGVFYNRLAIKMPLQSDATVNYITGKGMRQASTEDTKIDSPYNTYKYRGLPPGPICNPGLDAIRAAIWPEKNDDYYFLHPLNAPTVFSKIEEEHRANKAKWLK